LTIEHSFTLTFLLCVISEFLYSTCDSIKNIETVVKSCM
jgi:hypothetical protein